MMNKIYNFSAGPAMLPHAVLETAQQQLLNWQGMGVSVMELSHRGTAFEQYASEAMADLKSLLKVPENYKILFCQGGARGQFAAVPMNILGDKESADYIDSGYWSRSAANEAKKYCQVNCQSITTNIDGIIALKAMQEWKITEKSAYIHYCPNETIEGLAIFEKPDFEDKIVVADYSSSILSAPIAVSNYGIIYAGVQKNIGPAGITIVIVRDDLLGLAKPFLPSVFNYQIVANHHSMYNTPPMFSWYVSGLVFKWIKQHGGVPCMAIRNQTKAAKLYNYIDNSNFYINCIAKANRSLMNVPFFSPTPDLDKKFIAKANEVGILGIQGHRIAGGMRASIYNAMDIEGINYLIDFMKYFAEKNKNVAINSTIRDHNNTNSGAL